MLTSCGGSPGGGAADFSTVTVVATAGSAGSPVSRLESDVVTGNTCTAGVSSVGNVVTDFETFTITSTAFTGVTGRPVALDSYTIHFIPNNAASTSPPPILPDLPSTSLGAIVQPGSSLTLSIAVVPNAMKVNLLNQFAFPLCSSTVWVYYAVVNFTAIENDTTVSPKIITASLDVAIIDSQK
jgi:hypothetical protein